jgi:hypothetical protein
LTGSTRTPSVSLQSSTVANIAILRTRDRQVSEEIFAKIKECNEAQARLRSRSTRIRPRIFPEETSDQIHHFEAIFL